MIMHLVIILLLEGMSDIREGTRLNELGLTVRSFQISLHLRETKNKERLEDFLT